MTTPALQNFMRAVQRKTYQQTVLDDSPVGYWPCQDAFGSSTLADASGNGRNLTLNGTRALGAKALNSRLGNAVQFTAGSGFATISAAAWLQILGDVTLELWLHLQVAPTSGQEIRLIQAGAVGETAATNVCYFFDYINNSGTLQLGGFHESGSGTDNDTRVNQTLAVREWNHLVLRRDVTANAYEYFLNGVSLGTQGYTNDPTGATSAFLNINSSAAGTTPSDQTCQMAHVAIYNGQLSNARILEHYRAGKRASPAVWRNTVFLCNFLGADTATAIPDESSFGRIITFSGNAQIDTAQAPPGCSSSLLLDGTGDFVSCPDSPDLEVAGNQFCIESFVRMSAGGKLETISNKRDGSGAEEHSLSVDASNILTFNAFSGGSSIVTLTDPGAMSINTWYHVAAQRLAGNVWTLHRDGVLVDSDTVASSASTNASTWFIGRDGFNTARDWQGWIGPTRFTHGEVAIQRRTSRRRPGPSGSTNKKRGPDGPLRKRAPGQQRTGGALRVSTGRTPGDTWPRWW